MAATSASRALARQALSDAWDRIPGMPPKTDAALQMAQAWALQEGGDGASCWSICPGVCHNWGAVQLPHSPVTHDGSIPDCPAGSAPCVDTRPQPDGSSVKYGVCFKTYDTQADGAVDYLKALVLRSHDTVATVGSGDADAFSAAEYDSHYYEGFGATRADRIASRADGLVKLAKSIAASLGEPVYIARGGAGGDWLTKALVVALGGALGYYGARLAAPYLRTV